MKIAFITDLHIDPDQQLLLELDTRQRFLACLENAKRKNPDLLVLGGDLCHRTGSGIVYSWIFEQVSGLPFPCLAVSGNHDDSSLMAKCFQQTQLLFQEEFYYTYEVEGNHFIFLDSSQGSFTDNQWTWLRTQFTDSPVHVLLFMHHPPLQMNSRHMEPAYMFAQMDRMRLLCEDFPQKHFYFVTGHYHMERVRIQNNITVLASPSSYVQIDAGEEVFTPVKTMGYRWIEWGSIGIETTAVEYL